MPQGPRFQKLAADVKRNIREVSPVEAAKMQREGALIIDVRETEDFAREHAAGAMHVSRGVLELKIEEAAPNADAPIVCYCGGGSRSALAAESLQRMGYSNVSSVAGGYKAWKEAGLPTA
jgi:phage shock protein E